MLKPIHRRFDQFQLPTLADRVWQSRQWVEDDVEFPQRGQLPDLIGQGGQLILSHIEAAESRQSAKSSGQLGELVRVKVQVGQTLKLSELRGQLLQQTIRTVQDFQSLKLANLGGQCCQSLPILTRLADGKVAVRDAQFSQVGEPPDLWRQGEQVIVLKIQDFQID